MLMSVLVRETEHKKCPSLLSKIFNLGGLVFLEYLPAQNNTVHPVKQDWGVLLALYRIL